jgi:two-component system OmpR family sensor kinase
VKWWRWAIVLVPVLLGLVIGVWINLSDLPNPTYYMRIQLSALIFLTGALISILGAIFVGVWYWIELTRLDTELDAADDRRRFLRRLDHELKNPLTAIMAGLANISTNETPVTQSESMNSVESQVRRMGRLVADLRKLSELETRQLELTPVNLNILLEDAFAVAEDQPNATERQLNMSIPHAPWPLPTIYGDHDLLFLAVHNLLDNALKFTRPGDTIEMRAFEDGANVVVEVGDTGPGIPGGELPHVWEELYRGASARGVPGSGLGLGLVRAIVLRHNGGVTIRSRPDEGTVVTIRLPVGEVTKR